MAFNKANEMARQNLSRKVNGLAVLIAQLCETLEIAMDIYFPGSDEAKAQFANVKNMAIGLTNPSAGFPMATDLEQPVAESEVQQ